MENSIPTDPRLTDVALSPIDGERWGHLRPLTSVDPITRIGELAPGPVCLQFPRGELHEKHHAHEADDAAGHREAGADRLSLLQRTLDL